ncbi:hypothetical protein P7K49_010110, partial [Saguinus oedipus]
GVQHMLELNRILKRLPDEQHLYKDNQVSDDGKTLGKCGFTSQAAPPQVPATVGLAFRQRTPVSPCVPSFSQPAELLNVMRHRDSEGSASEEVVQ